MKNISLFFVLFLIINVNFQIVAQPQRIGKSETYWEYRDDTLFFSGKGRMERVLPVPWNKIKKNVKYGVVGEGITYITQSTFEGCNQMIGVSLPQSLRCIGRSAFTRDSNLRYVVFPDYVDSINYYAFYKTRLPDTLKLPRHLSFLDIASFHNTGITYVEVPYKIDTVGSLSASPLRSVVLPAGSSYLYDTFCYDSLLQCIVNLSVRPQTLRVESFGDPSNPVAFGRVKRSQCRLVVPTSAVELYKSTPVWKDFKIEAGGLSVGVCFNNKLKGDVEGLENRFYRKGEKLTLVAYPRSGCTFSGWKTLDGKLVSTANALQVTVTKDTMLRACFDGEVSVHEAATNSRVGDNVELYPNPACDFFSVRSEYPVAELVVCDLSGRVLLRTERTSHADVAMLPQGIYLVRVCTNRGSCVKKLVKR